MKTEETTLDRIRTRPRFKIFTNLNRKEVEQKLKEYLLLHQEEFNGNVNEQLATISVKTPEDHYWKPFLSIRTEIEEEKTIVRGVFGPGSSIWTLFMFLYFLCAVLWMTFFTMWFVERQIKSDDFPWALPASFAVLALILLLYLAARIGQSRAKKQMEKLRQFAVDALLKYETGN